jgi:hypothetical protein
MELISDSSTADLTRGSLGTKVSPSSLLFFGLPLLQGIYCWGDRAFVIPSFCAVSSNMASTRCDISLSARKGKPLFISLGMTIVSNNESQSLWGSFLSLMPLCMPFIMFWGVAIVKCVFFLRAMELVRAQGRKLDQPRLVRKDYEQCINLICEYNVCRASGIYNRAGGRRKHAKEH